ncbi:HNH endonuclease, partial [Comamonas jiangduensis]|uniref:HNH endonuclease n=1 Tax=Comamonas jiangduensis TaxID=1194168 RepID=UPI003BF78F95
MTDDELAAALRTRAAAGESHVLVIANKFSTRVLAAATASPAAWGDLGVGDIGSDTLKVLETAAKRQQVQWIDTSESDVSEVDHTVLGPAIRAVPAHMRAWCKERDKITGTSGRHGEVDTATRFEVASLAGWRCQFDGCGEDLRHHFVPGAQGNYSYFAHIVASSADGPRGDKVTSPQLANDPSNIMLMCDKCHRLIDRVAPKRYSAAYLNEMRQRNVDEV